MARRKKQEEWIKNLFPTFENITVEFFKNYGSEVDHSKNYTSCQRIECFSIFGFLCDFVFKGILSVEIEIYWEKRKIIRNN